MIRPATPEETAALMALCKATGLFQPQELDALGEMYFQGALGEDHCWLVDDYNGLVGVAYYAPETFANGVWNLYLIGIAPDRQGEGRGTTLLRHVEDILIERGERILLIETSGLGSFERTRAFYRKNGYDEEARIRDFYSTGDDKVVFRKAFNNAEGWRATEPDTT
jgi:ribosomal protein S18 acetylase RimI-like enzyme